MEPCEVAMENIRCIAGRNAALLLSFVLLATYVRAESKGSKYACSEANPAQLCNANNTCGSVSNPCVVDVKRTANAASATAEIQNAKGNALFCVKTGTTVAVEEHRQGYRLRG